MHDLNYFRDHLDLFAEMAGRRGAALDLDGFRALDRERRELITATEQLKAQRNKASDEIARLKKEKQNADKLIGEMKQVSERVKAADERIAQLDATQRELLLTIPNIPHASVPVGHSAAENVEVRRWGAQAKFDFVPKPHWDVGEQDGIRSGVDYGANEIVPVVEVVIELAAAGVGALADVVEAHGGRALLGHQLSGSLHDPCARAVSFCRQHLWHADSVSIGLDSPPPGCCTAAYGLFSPLVKRQEVGAWA